VKLKYRNKLSERASRNHLYNRKIKTEMGKIRVLPTKQHYLIVKIKKIIGHGGQIPKYSKGW